MKKNNVPISAVRWLKNGDHPMDNCRMIYPNPRSSTQFEPFLSDGEVVKRPEPTMDKCPFCDEKIWPSHGMIESHGKDILVCPGSWIVTLSDGEYFVLSDELLRKIGVLCVL